MAVPTGPQDQRIERVEENLSGLSTRIGETRQDLKDESRRLQDERNSTIQLASIVGGALLIMAGWFITRALSDMSSRLDQTRQHMDRTLRNLDEKAQDATQKLEARTSELEARLKTHGGALMGQVDSARQQFSDLILRMKEFSAVGASADSELSAADEIRLKLRLATESPERLAIINKALDLPPGELGYMRYSSFGVWAQNLNANVLAVKLHKRAFDDSGGDPEYGCLYARQLAATGKIDDAIRFLDELAERYPNDENVWVAQIIVLRVGNRCDEAETVCSRIPEPVRESAAVRCEIALLYRDMSLYSKVIEFAEQALSLAPTQVKASQALGDARYALGDFAGAENAARQALTTADRTIPKDTICGSLNLLASALKAQCKYSEAARAFYALDVARKWSSSRPLLWLRLCQILAGEAPIAVGGQDQAVGESRLDIGAVESAGEGRDDGSLLSSN